ncbi:hypothetical protein SAMN06265222_106140 [Neorhodopirellula lusitana]|uniref:Aminomethyltransferase folate-binding domain-containing protein n=1 Tax=Neorhodopirellula lusitana TaxID=445327 RepID=A0ABY1Q7C1_9BACT|nr:aminomethyltransferase [Neorhodopirellula lusitana]SMP58897.1 hypothetical protein SAMN06265222_106140 [Neorhodopirellula lusitana]
MMSHGQLIKLPALSVMDLNGKDAEAIMHNLTTNAIKSLQVDQAGTETFITNVKGKCLGHGFVYQTHDGFRFVGAPGQSEVIAAHADRYTIREDAVPVTMDNEVTAWLMIGPKVSPEKEAIAEADQPGPDGSASLSYCSVVLEGTMAADAYSVPWCSSNKCGPDKSDQTWLLLTPAKADVSASQIITASKQVGLIDDAADVQLVADNDALSTFHRLRVAAGFPWYGIDIDDSNLPQEINREPQTISFTKGCYLGQETVARLDALGQVQKKLVAWEITLGDSSVMPETNLKLYDSPEAAREMAEPVPTTKSKPVGRLTSVAANTDCGSQTCLALGFARRSHFEPGTLAYGQIGDQEFTATVILPDSSGRNESE